MEPLTALYKCQILPVLTYAAPSWFPLINKQQIEQLEKAQRFALRVIIPESYQLEYDELLAITDTIPVEMLLTSIM